MKAVSKITGHTLKGKIAEILTRTGKAVQIDESEDPTKKVIKQKDKPKRVSKKKK